MPGSPKWPCFPQVSPPKPWIRLSYSPHALHVSPISFVLILSPEQYWARSVCYFNPIGYKAGMSGHILMKVRNVKYHATSFSGSHPDRRRRRDMRRLTVAFRFLNATDNADIYPWRVWTSNLRFKFWETEVNTRLRQYGYSFVHHAWLVKFNCM
jgi:hypothetical protein